MSGMRKRSSWVLTCLALLAAIAQAEIVDETPLGSPVERQLPTDQPLAPWARDPKQIKTEAGDRLEKRKLQSESFETVKLKNVIPLMGHLAVARRVPWVDRRAASRPRARS